MNPKIDKLAKEIAKAEDKIAELQKKVAALKEQKPNWKTMTTARLGAASTFLPKSLQNS